VLHGDFDSWIRLSGGCSEFRIYWPERTFLDNVQIPHENVHPYGYFLRRVLAALHRRHPPTPRSPCQSRITHPPHRLHRLCRPAAVCAAAAAVGNAAAADAGESESNGSDGCSGWSRALNRSVAATSSLVMPAAHSVRLGKPTRIAELTVWPGRGGYPSPPRL
jgi:hypothetical protein